MAIIEGKAYWANITVPNTKFEPMYVINLIVPDKVADDFKMRGCSVKQMDEGKALIIKRKVADNQGNLKPVPKLFDKFKNPITDRVGNGSTVKVQYREFDWEYGTKFGKGLDLQAVQVIDLVEAAVPDGLELDAEETEETEQGEVEL